MTNGLLLSGGMDSLALAWWLRPDVAFTVEYGQKAAAAETEASTAICRELAIPHVILRLDARSLGSGDMAGAQPDAHAPASDWWPYRNQLLVTLTAMKAVSMGVDQLLLGTVASDCSHRDGTLEFINSMSHLLAMQEGGMTLAAPAIGMRTADLVRESRVPRSFLAWAHSCHKANVPCCNCRGCNKHFEVLQELDADVVDAT